MNVTLGLAFLAGLASFLSPCVFPLVPVYIGYLGGRSLNGLQGKVSPSRFETFIHGLFFVLGFSIVFVFLGAAFSVLGGLFVESKGIISKVAGVIVILFGVHITGIWRIPFLEYDLRPQTKIDQQRGYFSSMLMGILFSAGWTPCTGPVLGTILTLAANDGAVMQGVILLTAYSAGLAIPFLLAAVGIDWVTQSVRRHQKIIHYVEIGMGVVLILVGIALIMGFFEQLSYFGFSVDFGL